MNAEMAERLHKLLAKFVTDEGINPTRIRIDHTFTKALIVLDILPAPEATDLASEHKAPKGDRKASPA